jgi:tRNA (guanine-N7-)-methyltransferase
VGKNKLSRWLEMKSFGNVIEPATDDIKSGDHPNKGRWGEIYFKNSNPLVLELGCGKGEYTVGLARHFPLKNFTGLDIKGARIWRGAKTAFDEKIKNVLFIRTRIEFITSFFSEDEVDEIWITFPDPFPRRRDESRRLTSPAFLNNYRLFLRDRGIIHLKTDNPDLFRYTGALVKRNNMEILTSTEDLYEDEKGNELLAIRTHYENIFLKEGKKICYLCFRVDKKIEIR